MLNHCCRHHSHIFLRVLLYSKKLNNWVSHLSLMGPEGLQGDSAVPSAGCMLAQSHRSPAQMEGQGMSSLDF